MTGRHLFTSESVTEGHADKVSDQISDAVLDEVLGQDKKARVDCETLIMQGTVVVTGQITTSAYVNVKQVVRDVLKDIGFNNAKDGLDWETCGVLTSIEEQSPDIAMGVNKPPEEMGSGDQGIMFGYASEETPQFMPLPITLAHAVVKRLADVRKQGMVPYLRPDGKSQVTVEYDDGRPQRVDTVVVAAQHNESAEETQVKEDVVEKVVKQVIPRGLIDGDTKFIVNGTGRFVIGGTLADSGLTGRKIIVDTYGGVGAHGGGCFCITGDALVNHSGGLSRLKDLRDKVASTLIVKTDTHPMLATDWYDNGVMNTRRVVTEEGYALEGSDSQLVRVINVGGDYVWKRLDQITKGDYVAIQRRNRLFGSGVDLSKFSYDYRPGTGRHNRFVFPDTLTEDYAYLLGLLVGDGNCMMEGGISLRVCTAERTKLVQDLFLRLFDREGIILGHWAFVGGVELRAFLRYLGLDQSGARDKDVPRSIFEAPKGVVAAFIRGLFDTGGHIGWSGTHKDSPDIWIGSTSRHLICNVQALLLNFGIVTSVAIFSGRGHTSTIRGREVASKRTEYRLRIKGTQCAATFQREIGFGLPRKQEALMKLGLQKKRDKLTIPNQRLRIGRLWSKLGVEDQRDDVIKLGRFLSQKGKATKLFTYEKLNEFLEAYGDQLSGEPDFQYLDYLGEMGHYYSRVNLVSSSVNHVFDLSVPGAETFTANGFVCHNSGKDPTKVDRSGSYMARYIAKNIVAAGLAKKCQVQIAYAIGVAKPVSFMVDTLGTGTAPDEVITNAAKKVFDMRPGIIIRDLNLLRPIYKKTACYGHFGRDDPDFTWERIDRIDALRNNLN